LATHAIRENEFWVHANRHIAGTTRRTPSRSILGINHVDLVSIVVLLSVSLYNCFTKASFNERQENMAIPRYQHEKSVVFKRESLI
jgi:hypothetical protein